MGTSAKMCRFPYCQYVEDLERDCGFCSEHAGRWLRSAEFVAAAKDPEVKAYAAIGMRQGVKRELRKHARRWAKAEAAREEEGA